MLKKGWEIYFDASIDVSSLIEPINDAPNKPVRERDLQTMHVSENIEKFSVEEANSR